VIVDAHHHLWDPRLCDYPWMTGDAARLREPRGLDDLRAVTGPAGVGATIAVQAATTELETTWLLALAAESGGLVAGVVGWVEVEAPDIAERLAILRAAPGGERLVGIRHPVHDEPDAGWLDRDAVRRGLRAVAEAGLTYDLLLFPEHLPAALRVAEAIPELALVVDHGAKPRIADGAWEPWSSGLAALAEHERVHCKLSGLVTEARRSAWRDDGIKC
jgi:L-fuconolactonase